MFGFRGTDGSIVTEGLVYYIDNPNKKSYVSGSSVINNLVGTDTSDLPNGIDLTTENLGGWTFDGVDDYIEASQIDSQQLTLDIWFKINDPMSSSFSATIFRMGQTVVPFSLLLGSPSFNSNLGTYRCKPRVFFRNPTCANSVVKNYGFPSSNMDSNFLYNMIVTYDWATTTTTCYLNDSLVGDGSGNRTGPISATLSNFSTCSTYQFDDTSQSYTSMAIQRNGGNSSGFFPMDIYNFKMYNRVLNEEERNRNYNALKGRFGI
jgi:hypothetical protein